MERHDRDECEEPACQSVFGWILQLPALPSQHPFIRPAVSFARLSSL